KPVPASIMDKYFGDLRRNRTLTLLEARAVAEKYGYLFPTEKFSNIRKLTTYFGGLYLQIEAHGKVYSIGQMPPGSRPRDDEVEVFGNEGQIALSVAILVPSNNQALALSAKGGNVQVHRLRVTVLKSAWQ